MNSFQKLITNPFLFSWFELKNLPLAFVAGLRVASINDESSAVSVKLNYWTKNPFRSMYFAAQAMAAELSTGVLVMDQVQQQKPVKISMLVYRMKADFLKKAVGKITFTCQNGKEINRCINDVLATKEGQTITMQSIGTNEQLEQVAIFEFTWTLKVKSDY